jgi:hypothetical protein
MAFGFRLEMIKKHLITLGGLFLPSTSLKILTIAMTMTAFFALPEKKITSTPQKNTLFLYHSLHVICLIIIYLCSYSTNVMCAQADSQSDTLIGDIDFDIDNVLQGKLYIPDYPRIKGSQYLNAGWKSGEIQLLEKRYHNLRLWYDIYSEDLVWWNNQMQGTGLVVINNEQLTEFYLEDRHFINLKFSKYSKSKLTSGYYEVLAEDEISLLCKRKTRSSTVEAQNEFERDDQYFMFIDTEAINIQKKKNLLNAFSKEEQKKIKLFFRKNRVIYRTITDNQRGRLFEFINAMKSSLDG